MEKEFITYKQALALKELGFDEPCFAYYLAGGIRFKEYKDSKNKNSAFYNNTVCSIPMFSQAFRWFREKYSFDSSINRVLTENKTYHFNVFADKFYGSIEYNTYEEAELECLNKLIEIIKNEKHTLNTNV